MSFGLLCEPGDKFPPIPRNFKSIFKINCDHEALKTFFMFKTNSFGLLMSDHVIITPLILHNLNN